MKDTETVNPLYNYIGEGLIELYCENMHRRSFYLHGDFADK